MSWLVQLVLVLLVLTLVEASSRYPTKFPSKSPRHEQDANASDSFQIQLHFAQPVSSRIHHAFAAATMRWKRIIKRGFPDQIYISPRRHCGVYFPKRTLVEDLLIHVQIHKIDGPGNILGSAGPCIVDSFNRTRFGVIEFDLSDVNAMLNANTFESVIVHEIGHVLGLGTLWKRLRLISLTEKYPNAGGYKYLGENGNQGHLDVGGRADRGAVIEDQGGPGTAKAHWHEDTYDNELMTGYVEGDGKAMPLSKLTARALEDLGFEVDATSADEYVVPPALGYGGYGGRRRLRGENKAGRIPLPGCIKEFEITQSKSVPKRGAKVELLK